MYRRTKNTRIFCGENWKVKGVSGMFRLEYINLHHYLESKGRYWALSPVNNLDCVSIFECYRFQKNCLS
jgi:hypothetical protein